MDEKIIKILKNYILNNNNHIQEDFNVFITWKAKVLQNAKYLLCTNLKDNKYYEITFNGDKNELYIDEYDKINNILINKPFN